MPGKKSKRCAGSVGACVGSAAAAATARSSAKSTIHPSFYSDSSIMTMTTSQDKVPRWTGDGVTTTTTKTYLRLRKVFDESHKWLWAPIHSSSFPFDGTMQCERCSNDDEELHSSFVFAIGNDDFIGSIIVAVWARQSLEINTIASNFFSWAIGVQAKSSMMLNELDGRHVVQV